MQWVETINLKEEEQDINFEDEYLRIPLYTVLLRPLRNMWGQHRAHAIDTYSMLSRGYEPTGKDLKCQYSYRFQVEGYNNHEAQFGESRNRIHGQGCCVSWAVSWDPGAPTLGVGGGFRLVQ